MNCPLCNAREGISQIDADLRYAYDGAIYKCSNCTLEFLWPPMEPEQERRFYEEEYGTIFTDEKSTTPAELFRKQQPTAKDYLDRCRNRLLPTDRCLEIGCASGYFLDVLKPFVATVEGCESHHLLRRHCQDLGFLAYGRLEDCPGPYDKIFLWFVFEHVGDPNGFLAAVERKLAPGGEIILIVPNANDALLTLYDVPPFRSFYYTPAHHFYYSPETLTQMLEKCRFDSEVSTFQRYDLGNHLYWMQTGKPGGQGRYKEIFGDALYDAYRQRLVASGHGDAIYAVLRRKTDK